jgi:predicted nucleotidyltransferase
VATGTDTEASDLDILIDPTPEMTLFDIGAIRYKLKQLLGVPVDVLTPGALPEKCRQSVIEAALPIGEQARPPWHVRWPLDKHR